MKALAVVALILALLVGGTYLWCRVTGKYITITQMPEQP